MAAPERHKPTPLQIVQNAAASLIVIAVVGIWNAAQDTAQQLRGLSESMAGLRRDVDRHESLLMRFSFNSPQAERRDAPPANL